LRCGPTTLLLPPLPARPIQSLYVCRLFRTAADSPPGPWFKRAVSGGWSVRAGTATGYKQLAGAPQIRVTLSRPASLFATLSLDRGGDGSGEDGGDGGDCGGSVNIALFLCRGSDGGRVAVLTSRAVVASSAPFTNLPAVSVSARSLPVEPSGYFLVPVTYEPGAERMWTVSIFADYDLEAALV